MSAVISEVLLSIYLPMLFPTRSANPYKAMLKLGADLSWRFSHALVIFTI